MRVLLIESEPNTATAIELMLATESFNIHSTDLGEERLDPGNLRTMVRPTIYLQAPADQRCDCH